MLAPTKRVDLYVPVNEAGEDRGSARPTRSVLAALAGTAAILAGSVWFNRRAAAAAESETPPAGDFVEVDGVRLHYLERGSGRPLVLLHGNGALLQDWTASGVFDRAAETYRVIAFDRPGYGYSTRPGHKAWTPREQADLFARAFLALGIHRPIVLGHSWAAMVAAAIGLDHPAVPSALVLASGYYFPTVRPDALPAIPTAVPWIGDAMSHTLTPLLARLSGPLNVKMAFSPAPVPPSFAAFPTALALRPSHQRAGAIEGAQMIAAVAPLSRRYGELRLPIEIIAGDGDKIAFPERHAMKLRHELASGELRIVPGVGHMVHYSAPDEVIAAIDRAAARSV